MHTQSQVEVSRQPSYLFDDIERGESALVMRGDQPLFMAVPLGKGLNATEVRLDLAASLFDQEQISMGIAALMAQTGYYLPVEAMHKVLSELGE
jgi:hypothetical protein